MDTIETFIAFVGEMELSDSQLSLLGLLGLKDSRRSKFPGVRHHAASLDELGRGTKAGPHERT